MKYNNKLEKKIKVQLEATWWNFLYIDIVPSMVIIDAAQKLNDAHK